MRAFLSSIAIATGCSFVGSNPDAPDAGGGPGADAAVDAAAPIDGGAASCLDRWLDGSVVLRAPQRLALSSPGADLDLFLSGDELELTFSSDRGAATGRDLFTARRAHRDEPFGAPVRRDDVSSPALDSRLTMTRDGLVAIIASERSGGEGTSDLWVATRGSIREPFGAPTQQGLATVNDATPQRDPELSSDGLQLYYAIGSPQRLVVATRATGTAAFASPRALAALASDTGEADPSLSADQRLLVFSSRRRGGLGGGDLWYARRASTTADFGAPIHLGGVNSSAGDGDPVLPRDGCRLYFASDRGGDWDLYAVDVAR